MGKITVNNALKKETRSLSINFLCFGVWTNEYLTDKGLEDQVFHQYDKYPRLTMKKINNMSKAEFKSFLEYINLEDNQLCF